MSLETSRYCSDSFSCKRQEMPLLYAIVALFLFGSSTGLQSEEICYGETYNLPYRFRPPFFKGKLHFTPNKGGPSKLLMENGEAKDPRIKVSAGKVSFTDVKEKHGGMFSISYRDEGLFDVVILNVSPCSERVEKYYGNDWYYDAPEQSELLDFSPDNDVDQSNILWNRTNPLSNKGGRGNMKEKRNEKRRNVWEMLHVTQSDNGFYYFRKQDSTVLKTLQLLVKGYKRHHDVSVNDHLFIEYPGSGDSWMLTFTSIKHNETMTLMKAGNLAREESYLRRRLDRIQVFPDGIEISPVETSDSGTYHFIDSQGNVAKTVRVDVNYGFASPYVYVGIIVGIILVVIVCCCCVKKCCCKKSSTKREESAPQTAAAPAVYYHDVNQPEVFYAAPTTDHSDQPVVSSSGPSVVASGGQGVTPAPSAGSDFPSSDPGPRFELKGMSFPSAPPLGSDTSHLSDVYNSDKLNFL